jgi:ATP-binding cassette subfamily C protein LapB
LEQIDQSWWTQQIVAVPQEPEFFDGSILSNLDLRGAKQSEGEIREALASVGLGKFVDESPEGLDTTLGNPGNKFNLGFRKRLALARASLTNGKLVIMDEPTEGLDATGSQLFYGYLNKAIKSAKTVVVLSHDPAIIKGAGTLVNLDDTISSRQLSSLDKRQGQNNVVT